MGRKVYLWSSKTHCIFNPQNDSRSSFQIDEINNISKSLHNFISSETSPFHKKGLIHFPTKKTHCVDFKLISWQCWKNAAALVSFTAFRKKIYRGRGWIFGFRFSPYQASVCSTCPPMTTQIHFHTVGKPWLRRTGWGLMEKRGFNNVGETLSSRRFLWPVRWVNYDFLNLTTTQPESYGIRWHLI